MRKLKSFVELKAAFQFAAATDPRLNRGIVWCFKCNHAQQVDVVDCMANGWPTHCGLTMTLDAPDERAANSTETAKIAKGIG